MTTKKKTTLLLSACIVCALSGDVFATVWPVSNSSNENADVLTSAFGPRLRPSGDYDFHAGVDIRTPEGEGDDIHTVDGGEVVWAQPNGGYGWMVKIKHTDGSATGYAHLEDDPTEAPTNLSIGQQVTQGQHIGEAGGTTDDPPESTLVVHLHLNYYPPGVDRKDANAKHPLHILPHFFDSIPGDNLNDIRFDFDVSPWKVTVYDTIPGGELDLDRIELSITGNKPYYLYSYFDYVDFDERHNVGEQQTVNNITIWPEDFSPPGDQVLKVEFQGFLLASGSYFFEVKSIDVDGVEYVRTKEVAVEVSDLHVTAGPGDREITVSWYASNPVDHDHFDIYRKADSGHYIKLNESPIYGTGDMQYVDTTAVYNLAYSYLLADVDVHGSLTFHTPPETEVTPINGWSPPPSDPPSGLSGTIDGTTVSLSWTAPSTPVSKYHIFRSFRQEEEDFQWIASVAGDVTHYTDSVEEGLGYYYLVEAYDQYGGASLGRTQEIKVGENSRYFVDIASTVGLADIGDAKGASWADYDGDGDLDLYVSNSGENGWHDVLYRNEGGYFSDVTSASGLGGNTSWEAHFADYDNDGDLDVYLCGEDKLYANNGAGSFTDVTASSGLSGIASSRGAGWGDYDRDGDVDLFIVTSDGVELLYSNNADGTFTDVTTSAGIGGITPGPGAIVVWGDYDGDGDEDICAASHGVVLYSNNGDGTFTDVTEFAGLAINYSVFDAHWVDYNNDGDLDLHLGLASWYDLNDILFRNNGDGTFTDVTSEALLGGNQPGAYACWLDFDTDGDVDLLIQASLYSNNGDGTFAPLIEGFVGKTVAADCDGDGDEDVYVLRDGSNQLLQNQTNDGSSITVRLEGYSYSGGTSYSNRSAIGSKIRVSRAGEASPCAYREMMGSHGSPLEAVIGVNSPDLYYDVEAVFPSGKVVEEWDMPAGEILTIYERGYPTVRNRSFEQVRGDQIGYWTPYGTGSFGSSFTEHTDGSRSAHFVRTAADTGGYSGFYQRYIQVQPDSTYYMGLWVKTANMTSGYVMPTLGVWENGHIVSIGYITEDTDWTYLSGSWTAAGDEDRIQIQLPCAILFGTSQIFGLSCSEKKT